jgi:hypothetical protein
MEKYNTVLLNYSIEAGGPAVADGQAVQHKELARICCLKKKICLL